MSLERFFPEARLPPPGLLEPLLLRDPLLVLDGDLEFVRLGPGERPAFFLGFLPGVLTGAARGLFRLAGENERSWALGDRARAFQVFLSFCLP